jgi:ELAV like protein 2/3/4
VIAGLSKIIAEEELRGIFKEVGDVEEVRVKRSNLSKQSLGFAFVKMASVADAAKAIESLNGIQRYKIEK